MTELSPPTERIAKRIAASGICSRREAERLIEDGKVQVNGEVIRSPALNVSEEDSIKVRGKLISKPSKARLWLYHKPAGLLTTHSDPEGRPTVFSQLPASLPRVISVGRLDLPSEGLLLLTTSGELARKLELPATGLARTYRVRIFGTPTPAQLDRLEKGVTVDGIRYGSIKATIHQETKSNCWLEVTLHEGKNREIRKVFEHLGYRVSRLLRISYGPFTLGDLPKHGLKEVDTAMLTRLLKDL